MCLFYDNQKIKNIYFFCFFFERRILETPAQSGTFVIKDEFYGGTHHARDDTMNTMVTIDDNKPQSTRYRHISQESKSFNYDTSTLSKDVRKQIQPIIEVFLRFYNINIIYI